jgi:hypothetical protein
MINLINLRAAYSIVIVLGLMTVFSLPLGFDQHHSGLILSSLNEFNRAMYSAKEYPFNQYGPAWIFIFHFAIFFAPASYYFLAAKLVGLFLVFASLVATYKLAGYFLDRFWQLVTVGFMLITYPFFTGFLPWPSLVVMPIIPFATLVLVRFVLSKTGSISPSKAEFFCLGFLLGVTILTRAQIGAALIVATFAVLLFQGWGKAKFSIYMTLAGFGLNLFIILGYLYLRGWLTSALYDEFVMGFTYVIGDKSTYPFPKGTLILVTIILLTYSYLRLKNNLGKVSLIIDKVLPPIVLSGLLVLFTLLFIINVRLFNRAWISFVISVLLIFFLKFVTDIRSLGNPFKNPQNVLFLFSGVALLQIWPLFDQMHTWWALTPVSILASISLKNTIFGRKIDKTITSAIYVSIFLLISNHTLDVYRTYASSSEIRIQGLSLNYTFNANAKEMKSINDFLAREIPKGSSVLNFCSDANAFFAPKLFESASRNIVFWSPMKDNPNLIRDIKESRPTYIISCNYTPFSSQLYDYYTLQANLIDQVLVRSEVKSILVLSNSREISIIASKALNSSDQ